MNDAERTAAVVLLSGGQDSATCLAWAKECGWELHAISFFYGQRHQAELDAARRIAEKAGVVSHVNLALPLDDEALRSSSALTGDLPVAGSGGYGDTEAPEGLPTSFVPGRNLLFLGFAAARAVAVGARDIITGVCQTDYSGYPDCRADFVGAMKVAINRAMPSSCGPIEIHAPLMYRTKAETVQFAVELGAMDLIAETVTCYHGKRPGCGTCPACVLRARGFEEAGVADPAEAR